MNKINKYNIAIWSNNQNDWSRYKEIRNRYKSCLDFAKNKYLINKINSLNDQKDMWSFLKTYILKKQKHEDILEIEFPSGVETNSRIIADKFNKYFKDSIVEINTSIQHVPFVNRITLCNNKFMVKIITNGELKEINE